MNEFLNALLNWLGSGLLDFSAWQLVAYTLVVTHITIAAVTIFLHRSQAHRALDLGPIPSHFFRFWLWLTTGMVTKEWVAIHRKHHARCETPDDPHSPQTRGLKKVLAEGAELYRAEAKNAETIAKYSRGTPDDWIERNLYTRYSWQGVALLLIVNVALFGVIGASIWAIQMAWIPIWAAGVINGIGHYWGYRNFEAPDASTNISPWGIIIGGEELHNNHHTYPTSAKLSVKPYEFDIGWLYIRILETLGLATVKKTPPKLHYAALQPVANEQTLEALITNRYEVMASFARQLQTAVKLEIAGLPKLPADAVLSAAKRWMHRDEVQVPEQFHALLKQARDALPNVDTMVRMREELRQMWLNTHASRAQLAMDLQQWCVRAEQSGVSALRDFSVQLRAVASAPAVK